MPIVSINYLAVLVAALSSMVLGSIWYSPRVFGKKWMQLVGKKQEDIQKARMGQLYGGAFLLSLLLAYVMAHFVDFTRSTSIAEGFQTGFWSWLGFVATTKGVEYVFVGRPRTLYFINVGYHLVEFLIMGAILAVWA